MATPKAPVTVSRGGGYYAAVVILTVQHSIILLEMYPTGEALQLASMKCFTQKVYLFIQNILG